MTTTMAVTVTDATNAPEERTMSNGAAATGGTRGAARLRSHSADMHSDITDFSRSDDGDCDSTGSDIIALLQFRDSHHVLGLPSPRSGDESDRQSPRTIQQAYDAAKAQVVAALESQGAATGGRNTFFASQTNYLELKLQALDQAYEELMPPTGREIEVKTPTPSPTNQPLDVPEEKGATGNGSTDAGADDKHDVVPPHSALHERVGRPPLRPPSMETTRDLLSAMSPQHPEDERSNLTGNRSGNSCGGRSGNSGGEKSGNSGGERSGNSGGQRRQQNARRTYSEDEELDTIDIYFRPSPDPKNKSTGSRTHSPENGNVASASDTSVNSWDGGSSIFSMISKTMEDASQSGLSDVLGIYTYTRGSSASPPPVQQESPKLEEKLERRDWQAQATSMQRPPLGVDATRKGNGPRAQISPRSVLDFQTMHVDNHYDDVSGLDSRGASDLHSTSPRVVGRGGIMRASRAASMQGMQSHEANEAAKMGILRALSEDNSVCLSLNNDSDERLLQGGVLHSSTRRNEVPVTTAMPTANNSASVRQVTDKRIGVFEPHSDWMPRESNSLVESPTKDGPGHMMSNIQPSVSSRTSRTSRTSSHHQQNSHSKSLSSATSSSRSRWSRQRKGRPEARPIMATPSVPAGQKSKTSDGGYINCDDGEQSFDAIFESSMDLANELCVALNRCWNCETGLANTLSRVGSAALDAATSELERAKIAEVRLCQGNEDESTVATRSTYDEDTAVDSSAYTTMTDGESTAFNTMSSFGSQQKKETPNQERVNAVRRQLLRTPTSDPPPRMLV